MLQDADLVSSNADAGIEIGLLVCSLQQCYHDMSHKPARGRRLRVCGVEMVFA